AVGARGRDILMQFLVESVAISLLGGLFGVVLGAGASAALAGSQGWAVQVTASSVAVAFGFSAATGIFFGWWPARKAARLNPIEALRYKRRGHGRRTTTEQEDSPPDDRQRTKNRRRRFAANHQRRQNTPEGSSANDNRTALEEHAPRPKESP